MTATNSITQEGYDKLEQEVAVLQQAKRPKAVERLKKAREMGDLSENSEYTAAREDLNFIDTRIAEIEDVLRSATIVAHVDNANIVDLGDTVIVAQNGSQDSYIIVGEHEADVLQNKLSLTSPIGKALLGRKKGDEIAVDVPAGKAMYKIVEIK